MTKIHEMLNEQFNFEIESAYLYKAMETYVDQKGMKGFAHFFNVQAQEEMFHAQKFYDFMMSIDASPKYTGIPEPQAEFGNFKDTFAAALEHEKEVTRRIKEIYKAAVAEEDLDTPEFLHWFLDEQREEEETFRDIVERLERIGENWGGLYIFDGQLAQRPAQG
ncbi:MAG: ferritin [Tissierellia bacterium]|nr:ferritin [Tissierellia bacterium]